MGCLPMLRSTSADPATCAVPFWRLIALATPVFSACGAVWLYDTLQNQSVFRWIAGALVGGYAAATVRATLFLFIEMNLRHNSDLWSRWLSKR